MNVHTWLPCASDVAETEHSQSPLQMFANVFGRGSTVQGGERYVVASDTCLGWANQGMPIPSKCDFRDKADPYANISNCSLYGAFADMIATS